MQTFEAAFERQLGKRLELMANVYHYRLGDLIQPPPCEPAWLTSQVSEYRNVELGHANGFELEAVAHLGSGFKLDASLAVQRSLGGPQTRW